MTVDVLVISLYFAGFSIWSFWYKMNYYGSNLDSRASVQVEPFMPPVFGHKTVGQFDVWSYPAFGSYLFLLFGLCLLGAMYVTARRRVDTTGAGATAVDDGGSR